jgi:glycosyltransferase involved in cell wall biosynthesis
MVWSLHELIQRLKHYPLGILASEFRSFLSNTPREMASLKRSLVSLKPKRQSIGNVLLCYSNQAFFLKRGEPFPADHTNRWESWQIANTFLDLGYCVDVIDENNDRFVPTRNYSFFVGNRTNFARIASLLNRDAVKVLHIDTAHWLFHNMAECRRLEALRQRRGIILLPQRNMRPNMAIEHADYGTVLGNKFTIDTYKYANKPLLRIPISTPALYPWQHDKDFDESRKSYLWFGSHGFVHKGLDLVLEAFAQMPDYNLTVCGPIHVEKAFQSVYHKELYNTSNIHTVGWMDITSPTFLEIAKRCIGVVFTTCSESGGGGVITCMHAGLIPAVSLEASVDVDESMGVILKTCTVDEIKASVKKISHLTPQQLESMAKRNWEFARANHSREIFAASDAKIVSEILIVEKKKIQAAKSAIEMTSVPTNRCYSDSSARLQSPE